MKKTISLLLALCLALSLAACGAANASGSASAVASSAAASAPESATALPVQDRAGNPIALPQSIRTIVVMAPSIAEELIALGDADKVIGIDTQTQSYGYAEFSASLPAFDLMTPDAEQLAALKPDVVFVSGMSMADGSNPFQPLTDLGIPVVCIPNSNSISDIYEDVTFLGAVLGREAEAAQCNADLKAQIDRIAAIGKTIPADQQKTVYFEIASAPYAYSFGSGVYLNEMIELIGAKNVLADQNGWLSVDTESVVAANPDVIFTNVNYEDDAVGGILHRDGWGAVTAVANGEVYYIDNQSSSLPNQNIVTALEQMAEACYPEAYGAADKAA